jgi:hypothetical protein
MQDEAKIAALILLLDFLAPAVKAATTEDKTMALRLAFGYRPTCLTDEQQDTAQVYYAATILYGIQQQKAAVENGGVSTGVLKREKEGDLEREWAVSTVTTEPGRDPYGYMDQFEKLANICKRLGSITIGQHATSCCVGPWGV